MAVFTFLTESEIIAFLDQYDIGELVSFTAIKEGIQNTNYILMTTKRKYILTLYENYNCFEDVPFFTDIMKHLHTYNFPSPQPIPTKSHNTVTELKGKPATIISFLHGKQKNTLNINSTQCFNAGQMMGKMHAYLLPFKQTRKNTLSIFQLTQWYDKWIQNARNTLSLKKEIIDILLPIQNNWPAQSALLAHGVIHADYFPDNVFFTDDDVSGVIDFNFACNDFLVYDLAIAINAWCFNDKGDVLNKDLSSSFLSGYQKIRPLSQKEKDFFPIFCQGSAMRFLLSRLYDFETTSEKALIACKDPYQFLHRLRFHLDIQKFSDYC